jgi:hypothetical protein
MKPISSESTNKREPSRNITADCKTDSVVYFVRMGGWIKIGITTNLEERLRALTGHSPMPPLVMFTFPGGREEERRLHKAFAQYRSHGEFFQDNSYVTYFPYIAKESGIEAAWKWLAGNMIDSLRATRKKHRRERTIQDGMKPREFDAYCAQLVAERKRVQGW